MPRTVYIISGATATGKSALAIEIALRCGAEIISADSRQVYREMNIGSNKVTVEEQALVRHHLIDVIRPPEVYSAARFVADALTIIEQTPGNQPVVVVGGTGLYLKGLETGFDEMPEVPEEVRAETRALYVAEGLAPLLAELLQRDPDSYNAIDRQNPHRILRALEVCRATGRPFSSFKGQTAQVVRPFTMVKIHLELDKTELQRRIETRTAAMLANGLIEETEGLLSRYPAETPALQTIGYAETIRYLKGEIDKKTLNELIVTHTRQYAKRQVTFFKKYDHSPALAAYLAVSPDNRGEIEAFYKKYYQ